MGTSATSPSTLDSNLTTGGTNSQALASWAAPFVTDMLAKSKALSGEGYQLYKGPLTAGESDLQTDAFKGLAGLTVPTALGNAATTAGDVATKLSNKSYSPTTFTNQYSAPVSGSFDANAAQKYMNPFLMAQLAPQLEEARRQSQITQMQNDAKAVQAGAFGGSGRTLMNAETQRNLGTKLADLTGTGYKNAYDAAVAQFNAEQTRKVDEAKLMAQYGLSADQASELSKQFGANYDVSSLQAALAAAQASGSLANTQNSATLANLAQLLSGGNAQRAIEAEGVAADKAEFEKQRDYSKEQLKFLKDQLAGLPISAVTNTPGQMSDFGNLLATLGGVGSIGSLLGYGGADKNGSVSGLLKDLYGGAKDLYGGAKDILNLP